MISLSGIVSTGLETLGALSGVAVVAGVVAKFVSDHASQQLLQSHKAVLDEELETHKAALSRETETHKLTLKRQELIYQRELEAADAFMALWRGIYPQYRFPNMDWHDACEDVAGKLYEVETLLDDYLEKHAVALNGPVRDKLEHIQSVASTEKFHDHSNGAIPKEAIEAAEEVLNDLRVARDELLRDIRR